MTPDENRVIPLPPDRRGPPALVQRPAYEPEQSLLGAVLVRPEVFPAVIDAGVKADSFDGGAHATIFKAMLVLHGEQAPIDLVTVTTRLKEWGKLEAVGGPVFLAGLSEQVGFASNAEYYAYLVLKNAWRREYRQVLLQLHSLEQDPTARPDDLMTLLNSKLLELEASYPGDYSEIQLISLEELLAMKFPEKNELIDGGVWPAATALMICGESGVSKSLLLNQLAICLAMGWDFIGLTVPTARRVLVFQAENTLQQEQERYVAQIKGMGLTTTAPNICYFPMGERLELANPHSRKIMVDAIKAHQADAFFIDPLISFHTANENDNSAMRQVLDFITEIMRKTGAGACILHHFGKPTENRKVEHMARGASAIRDWCDTMITLTVKKIQSGYQHTLTFVKVRHGRQPKPITLERDENLVFQVVEEESRCTPEQVAQLIKAKGGKVNGKAELIGAIQDLIGCGEKTARDCIKAAIEASAILEVEGERAPGKTGPVPRAYVPNE
ncbi:MAG: AAA family ATPase [Desulfobaccales bacterium]